MDNNFKEEFERYKEAIDTDIAELEKVIVWLEQLRPLEYDEMEKIINFYKGYLARLRLEKAKTTELSWHIGDKE